VWTTDLSARGESRNRTLLRKQLGYPKAASGDLEQRTVNAKADYERGFADGELSATKKLEEIIRRKDTTTGELQREKAMILENQKRRTAAALLMMEQKLASVVFFVVFFFVKPCGISFRYKSHEPQ
jgi:hypothetical protein